VLGEGGTAYVSNGLNIVAFDVASGAVKFASPAPTDHTLQLVAALWGGGVAISDVTSPSVQAPARFDASGNLSYDGWASNGFVPNYVWPTLGTWYGSSGSTYEVVSQSELVPTSHSPWGFPGGNPSGNRSPVVDVAEDIPLWGSLYFTKAASIPDCQKPIVISGVTLPAKALLSTKGSENLLARITKMKDKLLLSGALTSTKCSAFFNCGAASPTCNPNRAQYYSQLQVAVGLQVQYDGTKSVINKYDAGMWEDGADQYAGAVADLKAVYVSCALAGPTLLDRLHPPATHHAITGMSQLQLPAHDVYYNENDLDYLVPGTILHEALHNLTRKYDENLRPILDLPATNGPNTNDITVKLETEGCAPKP